MEQRSVKVSIRQVDGGLWEFTQSLGILAKHDRLVNQGVKGKQLIHKLLGNDLGTPPVRVELSCLGADGKLVEISIPYQ